ncbi:hypothetical protein [Nocardia anaemiae]|uniref:hypothetical protein n=1 Tax=Nocardia anaemiae TaxID=263910 RepID=UPI0012F48627|nr:hypothetical protein [Nocardia anaemiae]
MKKTPYFAAAFLAASTLSLLPAGSAHAAASASSAAQICGSGYWPLDQQTLPGAVVYLSYNGSTDCVVTMKTAFLGQPTNTAAFLTVTNTDAIGGPSDNDTGNYSYYAGPAREYAPGKCIRWGGNALNPDRSMGGFFTEPTHCG